MSPEKPTSSSKAADSLLATRLTGQLHQAGYEAQLSDLFNHPRLADFCRHAAEKPTSPVEQPFVHSLEDRYQPFALTDVQQAYLVGASAGLCPGRASAHISL
ncbi:peptide synthetase [Escherichia coli]|uniref:Peptide synthetase n=1 Tax=Escherichia coli TaxID=562 RepID=A0A376J889_ECOLX|nr:peptide synthetase [Escherichia coli]